jgi:hypothetical protein
MRRVLPVLALGLVGCVPLIHRWQPRDAEPTWRRTPGFVSVGASWSCVRRPDGDVECWGQTGYPDFRQPSFESLEHAPRELVAASERACVGDVDDNLVCAHRHYGETRILDVWHYDVRGPWVCAAARCGGVRCGEGYGQMRVLDLDEYVDEVYVREDGVGVAVVHDRVYSWDSNEREIRAKRERALDPWTAYVTIRTCLDVPIDACLARPLPPVDAMQALHNVDLERSFGCGLDDGGRVHCAWYGPPDQREIAAQFLGIDASAVERGRLVTIGDVRASFVDVGDAHACALDEHGHLHCWGRNDACQAETSADVTCLRVG